MRDMTQDPYYIDVHNAIETIKQKVKNYNESYDELTDKQKENLEQLEKRLEYYNSRFDYIEIWYGILL